MPLVALHRLPLLFSVIRPKSGHLGVGRALAPHATDPFAAGRASNGDFLRWLLGLGTCVPGCQLPAETSACPVGSLDRLRILVTALGGAERRIDPDVRDRQLL